jgi:hypothetical protein
MKLFLLTVFLLCILTLGLTFAQTADINSSNQVNLQDVRLQNKIIPLDNPVYPLLDQYEASGDIDFLPQARPYTKQVILKMLISLQSNPGISDKEKKVITRHIGDLTKASNGLNVYKQSGENGFAQVGVAGAISARKSFGDNASWSTSSPLLPYLSGDLGKHLTFHAAMGPAIERLSPDVFYQSYTRDQKVNFPYQSIGYSYMPYQFNYETLYTHTQISNKSPGQSNITREMAVGMLYFTELNGSWLNGALQLSMNNQRRAWGMDNSNLVLSSSARRFPGVELKMAPVKFFRYSLLVGSLFSYANQSAGYKKNIYGYDIGDSQNAFALHLLEFTPAKWLQLSASAGNIWSKRFEISYMMPLVFSHFSEIEVGDYDNLSMGVDIAFKIPKVGKTWLSVYNDEFDFSASGPKLRMPRNRYAWQWGWKTSLLSAFLPSTTSTFKYTRVTPFVYTHYIDARFNTFTSRPLDMTYTHDGFNLGFYLPPNSGEMSWSLVNMALPDLVLSLDNKLIIHGTNDLASENLYQIYGDVYRWQLGEDIYQYPLLNFTKDGIYDWSVISDFSFDWKVRKIKLMGLDYFRVKGSLGVAHTWWESNESGVVAPASQSLVSGSLGVAVDI